MLESATPTTLLRPRRRPLDLRIRGGARDGQTLRLSAAKCLVGADDRCQLRLPGSDTLDCWILRGGRHTLLRSLRPGVQVNGLPVRDTVLQPGDTIQLGPYNLDVLAPRRKKRKRQPATLAAPAATVESVDSLAQLGQLMQRVDNCEKNLAERIAGMVADLENSRGALLDELRHTQPIQTHSEDPTLTLVQQSQEELDRQRAHVASENARLEARHAEHETWCRQTQEHLHSQLNELAARLAELEERRVVLEQARSDWHTHYEHQLLELNQQHDLLTAERIELERDYTEASALKQLLAAERDRLTAEQEQLAEQRSQLEHDQRALQSARDELAQAQNDLSNQQSAASQQAEAAERWQQINEREELLTLRSAELDDREHKLDAWREELKQRELALETQPGTTDDPQYDLSEQQAQLEAQQAALTLRAAELDEARRAIDEQTATLEAEAQRERDLLDQVRQELADERTHIEHQRTAWLLEHAQQQSQLDDRARELDAQADALQQQRDDIAQMPAPMAATTPVGDGGEQDVFRRLQAVGILKDATADDQPLQQQAPADAPASAVPTATDSEIDDEESINQYMRNLLERTRQKSTQPAATSGSVVSKVLRSVSSQPAEEPIEAILVESDGTAPAEPKRPRQRRQPAEQTHDMSAMRELANLSAQAALAHHQRQQQKLAMGTKIGIFLIALSAGVIGLVQDVPPGTTYWYASIASLAIAAVWGVQLAIILVRIVRTFRVQSAALRELAATPGFDLQRGLPADDSDSPASSG